LAQLTQILFAITYRCFDALTGRSVATGCCVMSGFSMRRRQASRLNLGRQGNMAALTAMLMPVLIGAAGLASDTAQWVLMRRALQR
jgi:hypothetical protein